MADEPVIITGGSVTITFNKDKFPGGNGHHSTDERRIVSVDVYDENTGQTQTLQAPANGKCVVTVHTENE